MPRKVKVTVFYPANSLNPASPFPIDKVWEHTADMELPDEGGTSDDGREASEMLWGALNDDTVAPDLEVRSSSVGDIFKAEHAGRVEWFYCDNVGMKPISEAWAKRYLSANIEWRDRLMGMKWLRRPDLMGESEV